MASNLDNEISRCLMQGSFGLTTFAYTKPPSINDLREKYIDDIFPVLIDHNTRLPGYGLFLNCSDPWRRELAMANGRGKIDVLLGFMLLNPRVVEFINWINNNTGGKINIEIIKQKNITIALLENSVGYKRQIVITDELKNLLINPEEISITVRDTYRNNSYAKFLEVPNGRVDVLTLLLHMNISGKYTSASKKLLAIFIHHCIRLFSSKTMLATKIQNICQSNLPILKVIGELNDLARNNSSKTVFQGVIVDEDFHRAFNEGIINKVPTYRGWDTKKTVEDLRPTLFISTLRLIK